MAWHGRRTRARTDERGRLVGCCRAPVAPANDQTCSFRLLRSFATEARLALLARAVRLYRTARYVAMSALVLHHVSCSMWVPSPVGSPPPSLSRRVDVDDADRLKRSAVHNGIGSLVTLPPRRR